MRHQTLTSSHTSRTTHLFFEVCLHKRFHWVWNEYTLNLHTLMSISEKQPLIPFCTREGPWKYLNEVNSKVSLIGDRIHRTHLFLPDAKRVRVVVYCLVFLLRVYHPDVLKSSQWETSSSLTPMILARVSSWNPGPISFKLVGVSVN